MERLDIRPAVPEDLERCALIEGACFPPEQAARREDIGSAWRLTRTMC